MTRISPAVVVTHELFLPLVDVRHETEAWQFSQLHVLARVLESYSDMYVGAIIA